MKALRLFLVLSLLTPLLVYAWPWSQDMMNQPSVKPQEPSNSGQLAPFPRRSVPVQGIPTQTASREEANELTNPYPPDQASIKNGRMLFRITCAACHGVLGRGDGPAARGLDPPVASLADARALQARSPLDFYLRITVGVAGTAMASFEAAMTPEDRWVEA